jgi:hydroxymethylpyrimidine kinase/phosphomethylpyrimidine kinase
MTTREEKRAHRKAFSSTPPQILTIAGSDPSGGAGIQADLKTFSSLGCYGMSVLTALTAQNTRGVSQIHIPPVDFFRSQLQSLWQDIDIDAIKIGMLGNNSVILALAEELQGQTKESKYLSCQSCWVCQSHSPSVVMLQYR